MNKHEQNYIKSQQRFWQLAEDVHQQLNEMDAAMNECGEAFLMLLNSISHRRMQKLLKAWS